MPFYQSDAGCFFSKEIDMDVVTREAFEAVPWEFRRRLCGAANYPTYCRIAERQLTQADDSSPHDICCDEETPSRGIVDNESSALAFGFDMMEAAYDDTIVVS
jgi:hypothetical protein